MNYNMKNVCNTAADAAFNAELAASIEAASLRSAAAWAVLEAADEAAAVVTTARRAAARAAHQEYLKMLPITNGSDTDSAL